MIETQIVLAGYGVAWAISMPRALAAASPWALPLVYVYGCVFSIWYATMASGTELRPGLVLAAVFWSGLSAAFACHGAPLFGALLLPMFQPVLLARLALL